MFLAVLQFLSDLSLYHPWWTSVLTVLITTYVYKWIQRENLRYPPGPWGLPIVGYLPFLRSNEHLELTKMRKIFGDIYSLRFGIRDVVVLNDFKSIKEAYNKEEVSARPPRVLSLTDKPEIAHLGDMESLKDWKESRRFTLSTLKTLGMGKNKVEETITQQIKSLLDKLSTATGRSQINLDSFLYPAMNHIVISLVCGRTVGDDEEFSRLVNERAKDSLEYFYINTTEYYLPFLKPFMTFLFPKLQKLKRTIETMEEIIWREIFKHEEDQDYSTPQDYMDYFIDEKKNSRDKATFRNGILNGNSQLLLLAGNDTTQTTIEWTLMYMAQYPDIQERAYQEIVRVIGSERPPSWDDKEQLPFLDAVISEAMRFQTLVPLADPHLVTEDTKIGSYDVPKDTVIISNIYAVHMDPELWNNPEEFNPDRFMTLDGKKAKDPEYLIPFSIGKRICPGEKLARVEVFLFVGAILQRFKVLPPSSGLNMESKLDLVVHPVSPFVKIEARH